MIRKRSEVQAQQNQNPSTAAPAAAGSTMPQDAPAPADAPRPGPSADRTTAAPAAAPAGVPQGSPPKTGSTDNTLVAEGDEVTVCYGTDKYSPVQYNTFEHGPFFVKVRVRAGETLGDAGARAWNAAVALAKGAYPGKAQEYLKNLQGLGSEVQKLRDNLK